jgi:hypothetical protein
VDACFSGLAIPGLSTDLETQVVYLASSATDISVKINGAQVTPPVPDQSAYTYYLTRPFISQKDYAEFSTDQTLRVQYLDNYLRYHIRVAYPKYIDKQMIPATSGDETVLLAYDTNQKSPQRFPAQNPMEYWGIEMEFLPPDDMTRPKQEQVFTMVLQDGYTPDWTQLPSEAISASLTDARPQTAATMWLRNPSLDSFIELRDGHNQPLTGAVSPKLKDLINTCPVTNNEVISRCQRTVVVQTPDLGTYAVRFKLHFLSTSQ